MPPELPSPLSDIMFSRGIDQRAGLSAFSKLLAFSPKLRVAIERITLGKSSQKDRHPVTVPKPECSEA
jgi:hypothetical protein